MTRKYENEKTKHRTIGKVDTHRLKRYNTLIGTQFAGRKFVACKAIIILTSDIFKMKTEHKRKKREKEKKKEQGVQNEKRKRKEKEKNKI